VTAVVGPLARGQAAIARAAARCPHPTRLLVAPPALAQVMAGADLAVTATEMDATPDAAHALSAFFAAYTRLDEYSSFQLWLDAWAEARRRPALGATSQRHNVAWQQLIVTTIARGMEDGSMSCDDPDATAWRVLSLLDGLSMQLAAHPGLIERKVVFDWAMTSLEREIGLEPGTLERPDQYS